MPNVFLNDKQLIEVAYEQEIKPEHLKQAGEMIKAQHEKLASENRPTLILIDVSQSGDVSYETRLEGFKSLNEVTSFADKIAVFGSNRVLKYIINFIIKAAGKTERVRVFETKPEAENWLLEQDHA
jgi:hypothetical protein